MDQKLLKGDDIAKVLGISRSLAYRLIRSGEIQSIKFGRVVRVPQKALDQFIQSRTSGTDINIGLGVYR